MKFDGVFVSATWLDAALVFGTVQRVALPSTAGAEISTIGAVPRKIEVANHSDCHDGRPVPSDES